jgi:hypothetical protein
MTLLPKHEARLAELAALTPGWFDGTGEAMAPAALASARELLAAFPTGYAFPWDDGVVMVEWWDGRRSGLALATCKADGTVDFCDLRAPNGTDAEGDGLALADVIERVRAVLLSVPAPAAMPA